MITSTDYRRHRSPEQIVRDDKLTTPEKIEILADWKTDLERLMESSDENMPPLGCDSDNVGDELQMVDQALDHLTGQQPGKPDEVVPPGYAHSGIK